MFQNKTSTLLSNFSDEGNYLTDATRDSRPDVRTVVSLGYNFNVRSRYTLYIYFAQRVQGGTVGRCWLVGLDNGKFNAYTKTL